MMHVILDAKTAKRLIDENAPLVAFDTETTGLDARTGYMIEIGAVRLGADGEEGKIFSALIKPPIAIPEVITQITGITDDDVCNADNEKEVLPRFLEYIDGATLIAHNAHFDLSFVNAALTRLGMPPLDGRICDTLTMARRLWKGMPKGSYQLGALADKCGIDKGTSHRATDDAATCAELFRQMARVVAEQSNA